MSEKYSTWAMMPDEVLINLYLALDAEGLPLEPFRTVCKKWATMIRQNELWKRLCHCRWQNNPSESLSDDHNLIPRVKSNRHEIAWRAVYLLRDMSEKLIIELSNLVAVNSEDNEIVPTPQEDYFASGWISVEGAQSLMKKIGSELDQIIVLSRLSLEPLTTMIELLCHFELFMLEYTGTYFIKEVALLTKFLEEQCNLFTVVTPNDGLLLSLAKYTNRLVKKLFEVDAVSAAKELLQASVSITPNPVTEDLLRMNFETFLYCIDNLHSKMELDFWMQTKMKEPVGEFAWSLFEFCHFEQVDYQMLALKVIKEMLQKIDTSTRQGQWTAMFILGRMHYSRKMLDDFDFVTSFVLSHLKVTEDPYIAIPMLYHYGTIFWQLKQQNIISHAVTIISALLDNPNSVVKYRSLSVLQYFTADRLAPHAETLFKKIAPIVNDPDLKVHQEAIQTIAKLVKVSPDFFSKKQNKDAVLDCLEKLRTSIDSSDVKAANKAMLMIGAKTQDSCFESNVYTLFKDTLQNFMNTKSKKSIKQLNAIAARSVVTLPKELIQQHFNELLSFSIHSATPNLEGVEMEEEWKLVDLQILALKTILKIIKKFDRDYLMNYYEQIKQALTFNFDTHYGVPQIVASKALFHLIKVIYQPNTESSWPQPVLDLLLETCQLFRTALQRNSFWNIREKVVRSFNQIIFHLDVACPTILWSMDGINAICEAIHGLMENFHSGDHKDKDYRQDFGEEVMKLFDFVLKHESLVFDDLQLIYEQIDNNFDEFGDSDVQWLDLRIVISTYNALGPIHITKYAFMDRILEVYLIQKYTSELMEDALKLVGFKRKDKVV